MSFLINLGFKLLPLVFQSKTNLCCHTAICSIDWTACSLRCQRRACAFGWWNRNWQNLNCSVPCSYYR